MNWLLTISLALNLVLVVLLQSDPSQAPTSSSHPSPAAAVQSTIVSRAEPVPLTSADKIERKRKKAPPQEVDDYPTLMKKLCDAGVNASAVTNLAVAEIQEYYTGAQGRLLRTYKRGEINFEEYQKHSRDFNAERDAELESLLGKEGCVRYQIQQDHVLAQLAQNGKVPAAVLDKCLQARKRNAQFTLELSAKFGQNAPGRWDYQEQVMEAQRTLREEMERTLDPDLARQFRLMSDQQPQVLRSQLAGVKISDAQLDAAAQIVRETQERNQMLDIARGKGDLSYGDIQPQKQTLEQETKDRLAALLGPERYAVYEKQTDPVYQQLRHHSQARNLADDQVEYVYEITGNWRTQQTELQKQLQAQQIKPEEYQAAIAEITAEGKSALQKYLGAEKYDQLKDATGELP